MGILIIEVSSHLRPATRSAPWPLMAAESDFVNRLIHCRTSLEKTSSLLIFSSMASRWLKSQAQGLTLTTNHDDLVCILFIDLCYRYMESVLQLCYEALYNHSLFLQAVHPWCIQFEGHCRYFHVYPKDELFLFRQNQHCPQPVFTTDNVLFIFADAYPVIYRRKYFLPVVCY